MARSSEAICPATVQLQLLGLAHVERRGHAPDAAQVGEPVGRRRRCRGCGARSRVARRASAAAGRSRRRRPPAWSAPPRRASSVARYCARAASFMRRKRPHTSTSQVAPTSARTESICKGALGGRTAEPISDSTVRHASERRVHRGEPLRPGDLQTLARLDDPLGGNPHVEVALERGPHERRQRVVLEDVEPRRVGEGGLGRGSCRRHDVAKGRRHLDRRPRIVRPHRAAGNAGTGHCQHHCHHPPRHCVTPSGACAAACCTARRPRSARR